MPRLKPKPSNAAYQSAAKQRLYRVRRQRCETVIPPIAIPPEFIAALIISGRLTEALSRDRKAVAEEVPLILLEWARVWLEK